VHDGGYNGEGQSPTAVVMERRFAQGRAGQNIRDLDMSSCVARCDERGAGYSYSSPEPTSRRCAAAPHWNGVADYINEHWQNRGLGAWGIVCIAATSPCRTPTAPGHRGARDGCAALRLLLLHGGRWATSKLVPEITSRSATNRRPTTRIAVYLQFEQIRTVMWPARRAMRSGKSGAGGFGLLIVPSLDW